MNGSVRRKLPFRLDYVANAVREMPLLVIDGVTIVGKRAPGGCHSA